MNFTLDGLESARRTLERIDIFHRSLAEARPEGETPEILTAVDTARSRFTAALDDDLNVSAALAVVFDFMHEINRIELTAASAAPVRETVQSFDRVLAVLDTTEDRTIDEDIERLIEERQAARKAKDYAKADAIRDQLTALGISLEDTPQGIRWRRK